MTQEHLGLFDTPPGGRDIRLGLAFVIVLSGASLVLLPAGGVRMREITPFVPVVDAMMCLGDLITATLLFAQASVFRSRALAALATGYLYTALLLIPHALTFPGAFAPDGLLGAGPNTTSWIAMFRRLAFPTATILYVVFRQKESGEPRPTEGPGVGIHRWMLAAVAIAAAVTGITTIGSEFLPPYFVSRSDLIYANAVRYESAMLVLYAVAAAVLFRKRSSVLDHWLLVAFACWLIQSLQILTIHGRFTLGFYWLQILMLFSHLIVMLALIAESNRLYARLVLATSARNREREARLMSLDALAATFIHEIGQPLAAVGLQAGTALNRLTADPPNVKSATRAQRSTLEAWRRTQDVLKSIRSTFAQRPASRVEFSLNEVVRTTTSLMARDLASQKVSLELSLDEVLPPILADRVQIERVLVNLLTNAIESVAATQGRPRRVKIRTALDAEGVLLEVCDNGIGIAPEKMPQIFDAFFTTKSTGTGLGLALCRAIVGGLGGKLWASAGNEPGATFHVRLPRSGLAET